LSLIYYILSTKNELVFCIHYILGKGRVCTAFPKGIPDEIWKGDNDHKRPYTGDHGIKLEPIEE
jgi:hypothetical protein